MERISLIIARLWAIDLTDLKREDGQGITEYGVVLAFVAIALAGLLMLFLKGPITDFITAVGDAIAGLPASFGA